VAGESHDPGADERERLNREVQVLTAAYVAARQEDSTFATAILGGMAAVATVVLLSAIYLSTDAHWKQTSPMVMAALPSVPLALIGFQAVICIDAAIRRVQSEAVERRLQGFVAQQKGDVLMPAHLLSDRLIWEIPSAHLRFKMLLIETWVVTLLVAIGYGCLMLVYAWWATASAWGHLLVLAAIAATAAIFISIVFSLAARPAEIVLRSPTTTRAR
jgi:hypothetical protein